MKESRFSSSLKSKEKHPISHFPRLGSCSSSTPLLSSTWTTIAGGSSSSLKRWNATESLVQSIVKTKVLEVSPGHLQYNFSVTEFVLASWWWQSILTSWTPQVKVGGVTRYHTVGYSTVYEYYAYGREVNRKRPRIAQMVNIIIDSNRIIVSCTAFNSHTYDSSLCCHLSKEWVLVRGFSTPSIPITKETQLL